MRWKDNRIMFSALDLQVLKQAGARMEEIPQSAANQLSVPPIWSLLSYTLLTAEGNCSTDKGVWMRYRALVKLVKEHDRYYRWAYIPKSDGKSMRCLSMPDCQLAQEQRWIYENILKKMPVSPYACAYQKDMTLRDCAKPHRGKAVLLHLDIRDFFGSITEGQVRAVLRRGTGYSESTASFLAALCCHNGHLPQGACTSPALSNLVMRRVDSMLECLTEGMGYAYTRYADDIFISGDIDKPQAVIWQARDILRSKGFALNEEKTRVLHREGQSMRVVGIVVNEKLQVSREYRRRVRQEVYYLRKYGMNAKDYRYSAEWGEEHYLWKLLGKVSYILQINPEDRQAQKDKAYLLELLGGKQKLRWDGFGEELPLPFD